MANVIKLGYSNTSGQTPDTLSGGEVGINTYNQKIWVGNGSSNTLVFNHADYAPASANASQTYVTSQGYITDGNTGWNNSYGFVTSSGVTSVATSGAINGGTITSSGTISHSTAAGNKHVPTGGASGNFLKYSSSGTAVWATPSYTTNTDTWRNLGSTSSTAMRGDHGTTAYTHSQAAHAPSNANYYAHPDHPGDDFSVDTGALTGATVVSDIDINVTSDPDGHVTDANGSVATRTLTLANLGYTGATNANYSVDTNTWRGLGGTSALGHRGDHGVTAYNHSQAAHAPSNANYITNNNQLSNGAAYVTASVVSGYATSASVTAAINAVIDAAPGALNTLNELAAAIGDDSSYATTVTNALAGKLGSTAKAADSNLLDGIDSAAYLKSPTSHLSGWQNSNKNFSIRTGGSACGLHMEESDGTFGFQLYGDSSVYGFLTGEWGAWDIQKAVLGTFKVDEGGGLKRVLNEANFTSYVTLASLGYTGATNANYITNNNQLTNGAGYTTAVGDITSVTAGTGMTGGGTSGAVTLNCSITDTNTWRGLGGTSSLGHRGDHGVTAYNHSQAAHAPSNANYYAHPDHPGDDFSVDTGALSGATVVSDIDINVTSDPDGHVTDANGSVATRTLTLANLGYTGATNANNYSFPYTVSPSAGNSTVVQRSGSGYILANYFNGTGTFSTSGADSGMGRFTGTNGSDNYGRSYSATGARALLNVADGATNTAAPYYTSAIAEGDHGRTQANFTDALRTKLNGIASGAQVNTTHTTNTWRSISDSVSTTSASVSASQTAVKAAYDRSWPNTQLSLSNSVSSTSTTVAASSAAAKTAYDRSWPNTTYSEGDHGLTQANFTDTLRTKLNGIASGAQVNTTHTTNTWRGLGGTSALGHRGDHGVTAYNHSQAAHAPSNANYITNNNQLTNGASYLTTSGKAADSNLLDGVDSTYFNRGDNLYAAMVGTSGWNLNDVFTTRNRSGFFDAWSGTNFPGTTTHVHGIQCRHNSSAHYGWQLAGQYSQDGKLYMRGVNNGSFYAWRQIWTSNTLTNNNQLTNGSGYTTNVGDITGVTAGTGMTGGGTSGTVTLNCSITDTNTWRSISDSVTSTSASISASQQAVKTAYDRSWPNTTYSEGDHGLTQANFTDVLRTKLNGIAASATNTAAPYYTSAIAEGDHGRTQANFTDALRTKLNGIATGAQVNTTHTTDTWRGLGGTSALGHRGDHGVTAYNHSQAAHAPSNANNYSFPYTVSASAGNSTVVQRHSSGYIFANYFNTTPNDVTSGITKLCVETGNDGYIRHSAKAAVLSFLNVTDGANVNTDTWRNLGSTSTTAMRGDHGTTAYTHSQASHAPSNANYITNNNQLTNGAGYTTAVGDITGVTAGTGMSGGGTSGTVTLTCTVTNTDTWRAIGNGSTQTARGDHALTAYNHSQAAHAPSNANYITNNNQLSNGAGYITSYTNTTTWNGFQNVSALSALP